MLKCILPSHLDHHILEESEHLLQAESYKSKHDSVLQKTKIVHNLLRIKNDMV